jgi:hypothetical protein
MKCKMKLIESPERIKGVLGEGERVGEPRTEKDDVGGIHSVLHSQDGNTVLQYHT